jgi:hypothetical protein
MSSPGDLRNAQGKVNVGLGYQDRALKDFQRIVNAFVSRGATDVVGEERRSWKAAKAERMMRPQITPKRMAF